MTVPDLYTVHLCSGMVAYNAPADLVKRWKAKGIILKVNEQLGPVYPDAPYDRAYGELGRIDTGEEGLGG